MSSARTLSLLALLMAGCTVGAEEGVEPPGDLRIQEGQQGGLMQSVFLDFCAGDACGACTGALLGPRTLITAAHCVVFPGGLVDTGLVESSALDQFASIDPARVVVHPSYPLSGATTGQEYDVALVRLAEDMPVLEDGPFLRLSTQRPEDESTLWLNGRMEDGELSDTMQHAVVRTAELPPDDPRYPYQILDSAVETGDFTIDGGDSGGPLFRETGDEPNDGMGGASRPYLYGLVSRGGSYARLDPIRGWILAEMEGLESGGGGSCDAHHGDVEACDATDGCSYYVCADECHPTGTEGVCTGGGCRDHDGDVEACDATDGCSYYVCADECHPTGTEGVCTSCRDHDGDVEACDATAGCSYYLCTDECHPTGTENVCS